MTKSLLIGCFGLLILATSCATQQQGPAATPTVDVTGRWVGSWTHVPDGGLVTLSLQQSGSAVIGNVYFSAPAPPQASGSLVGTVEANRLSYRTHHGHGADLTVNGDEMDGRTVAGGVVRLKRQQ
jgi:hypothetical protein